MIYVLAHKLESFLAVTTSRYPVRLMNSIIKIYLSNIWIPYTLYLPLQGIKQDHSISSYRRHNNSVCRAHSYALRLLSFPYIVSTPPATSLCSLSLACWTTTRRKCQTRLRLRTLSNGVDDSTRHVHWPWRGNSTKVISIPALSAILPYEWMQPPYTHTYIQQGRALCDY